MCSYDVGGPFVYYEDASPKAWRATTARATKTLVGSLYAAYNSIRATVPHGCRVYVMRNGSNERDPRAMCAALYYSLAEAEKDITHFLSHNCAFTVADIPQMDIVAFDGRTGLPPALNLHESAIRRFQKFHRKLRAKARGAAIL